MKRDYVFSLLAPDGYYVCCFDTALAYMPRLQSLATYLVAKWRRHNIDPKDVVRTFDSLAMYVCFLIPESLTLKRSEGSATYLSAVEQIELLQHLQVEASKPDPIKKRP